MISYNVSVIALTSDSAVFAEVTKGGDGLAAVSASIRYRSAAAGRNFLKNPQVTLSIEHESMLPSSRRSRLATCAPVMTVEAKKDLPPATRASDNRGRFIPEFDNELLHPNMRPLNSSRYLAGSSARTMKNARWRDSSHPGNA